MYFTLSRSLFLRFLCFFVLYDRDTEPVVRHPNFRLFACMNPATDVGKKDLPPGVRNRYLRVGISLSQLEIFVDQHFVA